MSYFDNFIFNAIVITEPTLLYLFYTIKKKNLNEKASELLLNVSLFSSYFLSIYFNSFLKSDGHLIFITLPILLTFLHKKPISALLMCIMMLDYVYIQNPLNLYVIIPAIILYFTLYYIYKIKTFKDILFINLYSLITLIILIIMHINDITTTYIFELILTIIFYYLIAYTIYNYIKVTKETFNIHMTIKEIEKEKHIQTSLFKITHEIKNPLAVVKGYLSMFNIDDKEKSKKYISIIESEVNRSLNILDDFKEFSKINIEKQEMNTNTLFDDIKTTMIPFFKQKNIELKIKYENVTMSADASRLNQVIVNLLKNASEACDKKHSLVSLTSFKDNNNLFIIVKDNGMGMDKDTLENLSTPFHTTKRNGTGLGVCLSKEIIEAHGGQLTYTSILNKGTTAKIVLPIN